MFPFAFCHQTRKLNQSGPNQGFEVVNFEREPINLFAAEVRHCELHWHTASELICVVKGAFSCMVNGQTVVIKKGGMVYISPNEIHSLQAEQPNSQLITVQFSPALHHHLHSKVHLDYCVASLSAHRSEDKHVWHAMLTLALEHEATGDFVSFYRMSLIYKLFSQIEQASKPIDKKGLTESAKDEQIIKECLSYIDLHYMEPLSLRDLSDKAGLSYHYFSRLFKNVCGFNFKEYLTFVRVSKSVTLLYDTTQAITDIAYQSGLRI
ncbi:helix-turn-helix domain-containing protein [Vibrio sp. SCSIO 43137]|uniref:helix-turn-helix domain-containing protein n=1 Tax=Vibrio sp. SCSIO 43137 TaxID=3021011 RepID=UPI0023079781|nr:AraC family transcriptional regulator [Vibrio sp. SCSIO 43137]WCE28809.1 AraC family transcriptional regulator [Vibrio sp. SCSIO 43137]